MLDRVAASVGRLGRVRAWVAICALAIAVASSGCRSGTYVSVRRAPRDPLAGTLQLVSYSGPKPTARTEQLLRRYDLAGMQERDPDRVLKTMLDEADRDPSPEKTYSCAELAYIAAKRADAKRRRDDAADHYAVAVSSAYEYLMSPRFDGDRNPYDPEFRQACDIYNGALEGVLRIANANRSLRPGTEQVIQTANRTFRVDVRSRGPWKAEEIEKLEFVSDYELQGGLKNHYQTFGLGVPMIVVRKRGDGTDKAERFYPPGLSFAATAFLRVAPDDRDGKVHRCALELHDPLLSSDVRLADRKAPLETDLSTPLAYFLDNPALIKRADATLGLIKPGRAAEVKGLYMIEPYDPNRVPVVMVHGLWSNPLTWMEMFNDLRALPEIRSRYQFWFFMYPTGQPFWNSAADLRDALTEVRGVVDPDHDDALFDQMVLVGHSMGGLVSRMQTIESEDAFWGVISDKPLDEIQADDGMKSQLKRTLYFRPNESIKRVVTIGTPHQGSDFANGTTRWLSNSLIEIPEMIKNLNQRLTRDNPGAIRSEALLHCNTSVDSLAPESPIFPAMLKAPRAPWVKYHNIVGVRNTRSWTGRTTRGDGVVDYRSAKAADAISEIMVDADHVAVHRHPRAVLEVRRILIEHWNDFFQVDAPPTWSLDDADEQVASRLPPPIPARVADRLPPPPRVLREPKLGTPVFDKPPVATDADPAEE